MLIESDHAARLLLRAAVRQTVTCPFTGEVLDVTTAVLIDATRHGGGMAVLTAKAWDHASDLILGHIGGRDHDVYDGRLLYTDVPTG